MAIWPWVFLVLAIIAAVFGFSGFSPAEAGVAKVLAFLFIAVFVIGLIARRRAV